MLLFKQGKVGISHPSRFKYPIAYQGHNNLGDAGC